MDNQEINVNVEFKDDYPYPVKLGRTVLLIIFVAFLLMVAYMSGVASEHTLVRNRAANMPISDCYSQYDIDNIVFGEIQE